MEKKNKKSDTVWEYDVIDKNDADRVRQTSSYKDEKCPPDNNLFFEERSNPLSSKGN